MNQGFHGGSHKVIYFAYLFVIVCSFNKCVPCEPTLLQYAKKNALLIENSARNTDDPESKMNMICL